MKTNLTTEETIDILRQTFQGEPEGWNHKRKSGYFSFSWNDKKTSQNKIINIIVNNANDICLNYTVYTKTKNVFYKEYETKSLKELVSVISDQWGEWVAQSKKELMSYFK
jgi:hypothetical protein